MRYACAATAERTTDPLARNVSKTIRNRGSECIRSQERQHLNRRIPIRKRSPRVEKNSFAPKMMESARPRAASPNCPRAGPAPLRRRFDNGLKFRRERWLGFSEDDDKQIAEATRIWRQKPLFSANPLRTTHSTFIESSAVCERG